ncbi:MAG: alpha/beta hydrolase [Pseudonocardia sp.]
MAGRHARRVGALALVTTALVGLGVGPAAAETPAAAQAGPYRVVPCADIGADPSALAADAQVECGLLDVPENRSVAGSATISLAVLVARPTGPDRLPDPLVFAQGGPGGATIETYLALSDVVIGGALAQGRDAVLFDQRGTGASRPGLFCAELDELIVRTAEQDLSPEESTRGYADALGECRARLVAEGIDLAGYTTAENAADVEALRVALRYEQINFYGVSYGTALGLELLRSHPQGVRSAVLDAVVPPQVNFIEDVPASFDGALTALVSACTADTRCNAEYPDLEQTLLAQVQRLNRESIRVPVTDPASGITYQVPMDGDDLIGVVFQLLYPTELLGAIPLLVDEVRNERYAALGDIIGLFIFDRTLARGMYHSVQCAEDADIDPNRPPVAGVRPAVAELGELGVRDFLVGCARWAVPAVGPSADAPVTSDVPTLLLSGRFDPITPAANAATVAATLPRSRSYTFPNTGHGAFGSEPCAEQIVTSFLDDPTGQPADDCLAALGAPRFYADEDIVSVPALPRLAGLQGRSGIELAVFGGAVLVLLTAWLLLPLAWLIRLARGRRRPGPPSRLARAVPWLVVLDGLVLVGFAVALGVVVFRAVEGDQAILLFGLPAGSAWVLALPAVAIVLGLLVGLGVIAGLRAGGWRVWRRIYLALLGVAAVSCTVLLGSWALG